MGLSSSRAAREEQPLNKRKDRRGASEAAQPQRTRQAQRYHPDPDQGLTAQQIRQRVAGGLVNGDDRVKTKTEGQIIRENVFTFFNLFNFILGAAVILVGSPRNALFLGVIVSNIVIGSFQGIRAKRAIDKLSLISAPKAKVVRDGRREAIRVQEVALDDVLLLAAGDQVCADCVVVQGECEVNESLLTGEADPVPKGLGDPLLSGSFLVSGGCAAQVERVGEENYASRLAGDAKAPKRRVSEIMDSIDLIVKVIGFAIVPIGALLFWKSYFVLGNGFQESVVSTTAGVVGMIPEGLVLLVSVALAVSVARLSAHKTLVRDLYCIETLARVDTLCLDKTGTITEGAMRLDELVPLEGSSLPEMEAALSALVTNLEGGDPTSQAIRERFPDPSPWKAASLVPFSSARKWSGAFFPGRGTYALGAGEFLLGADFEPLRPQAERYAAQGQRVLVLVHAEEDFSGKEPPEALVPLGLALLSDRVRREAPRTLRYFADQGVDLKVISGDSAVTVANIARKAGLERADEYIDASTLRTEEELREALGKYAVFGRVTPQQKLAFVKALKAQGHTVAMTGDGVNDVLALKEADCSIAMASGSDAARAVSNLVLLDSNFASMPLVVQEGRRAINNLQRSSSLFLVKTIFSALIGVLFIFLNYAYPFQPIQLTLISSLTIGAPSFILALEPNKERLRGHFIRNVIRASVPAALTMTANVLALCAMGGSLGLEDSQLSTLAVILTAVTGFIMLFRICAPFNGLRATLFGGLLAAFLAALLFFRDVFFLVDLTLPMFFALLPALLLSVTLTLALLHLVDHALGRGGRLVRRPRRRGKTRENKN